MNTSIPDGLDTDISDEAELQRWLQPLIQMKSPHVRTKEWNFILVYKTVIYLYPNVQNGVDRNPVNNQQQPPLECTKLESNKKKTT